MTCKGLALLKKLPSGYVLGPVPTFGENLRKIRRARKLKTKDLAEMVRVKSPTVSQWEREPVMPETPTLLKLAKALRCSVDALLEGVDDEFENVRRATDLIRHGGDQLSGLQSGGAHVGVGVGVAIEARVQQLEEDNARLLDVLDKMQDAASEVMQVVAEQHDRTEGRNTHRPKPRVRTGHRKTG